MQCCCVVTRIILKVPLTITKYLLLLAANVQAPTDRIFARYLEWIQECKEAVHTLRMCIKQAKCHREKCCSVLGAALGAALALEQAVYNGSLHTRKAQELQRLCAAVTAAIELAQQRVQVSRYTSTSCTAQLDGV